MLPIRNPKGQFAIPNYATRITHGLPLAALILLATYPILSGGLPTTGDGLNHYYRFAELDWHIRHGDFYPRWFANMHYGFGAPLLNFYAPLSYYIPFIFRIFGLSLAASLQLSYALALAVAILGAHQWAAALLTPALPHCHTSVPTQLPDHPTARLLAASAYGLAPYFYFNIFHRGAYPETWALALAPWLLWSTHRLAIRSTTDYRLLFTVLYAALILTHTLSALLFTPIVVLYLGASQLAVGGWPLVKRRFVHCSLFIVHSFALAAFFILPILLESQYIQLSRTYSTGDLDYHRNFLSLATLLSPPPNFDPRLVFNVMPPSLGWPQLLLAIAALFLSIRNRSTRPAVLGFWILGFGISLFTLSLTEPLWNLAPFARFVQFPWRLVGPVSLLLAALSPLPLREGSGVRVKSLFASISIAAFFLFSLPWTYHADFTLHSPLSTLHSPIDTINYEITSGQLGTASTAEYLPRWVAELPDPETLTPQFAISDLPSRLATLPAGVNLQSQISNLNTEKLSYTAPSPFTATYNIFYFPGWAATLDLQPVNLKPSTPYGLITVALPAGSHTLRLYRQLTPPQLVGTLISLTALVVLIILVIRRPSPAIHPQSLIPNSQFPISNSQFAIALSILALLLSRLLYFDRAETFFHHTNPIPNPISVNFDNQLELIGYEFPKGTQLTSGSQLPITVYWKAISPLSEDYSVSIQLADRFGNRFGQSDSQHPNSVPTSRWSLDQYARDEHHLLSLTGTPPGDYRLLITAYSSRPLSILQDSAPIGVEYELGAVTVTRAAPQPPGPLTPVEFDLASDTVSVGDQLVFTALWNSGDKPLPDLSARLLLADSANQTIFAATLPPAGEDYPTTQWAPNELIRYPYSVGLPPDLPGGAARVSLLLLDANDVVWAGPFDLGTIAILVPQRSFTIPSMAHRVDYDFRGAIRLLGYDLASDTITLYWQSLQPASTRLTVFVHRLDANGAFVAGHDSPPPRPTTSWLPGEVLTDAKPFVAGDRFEIGLYDPTTGERFGEPLVVTR